MKYNWKKLVGDESVFALEERIFHAVCIALIISVAICIPASFLLHIPQLFVLLSIVAIAAGGIYYLSRFKGLHQAAAVVFQLFVNLALVANYYYNSGVNGPTYAIFLLAFLVTVATCPVKQYYVWLPLNVILIITMLTIEFMVPGIIVSTYKDNISRYTDLIYSYIIIAAFAFLVTAYIRKTYNRQREELLAQSEALRAANATRNKLLSILSHDLKEPLNSLQGYLQVLADFDFEEDEKKEMEKQLLIMTKNTSHMLSNILLWANDQTQRFQPDLKSLPLQNTLRPVVELASSISRSKKVTLHIDIPEHIMVSADQQMLELIVRNLLVNAIKFTPQGKNIWLSAQVDRDNCMVKVKDEGVGIPPELKQNIFSLGAKPGIGTDMEKGTGLGLVLCKEFAELMKGDITFESNVNEGALFTVTLPASKTKPKIALSVEGALYVN